MEKFMYAQYFLYVFPYWFFSEFLLGVFLAVCCKFSPSPPKKSPNAFLLFYSRWEMELEGVFGLVWYADFYFMMQDLCCLFGAKPMQFRMYMYRETTCFWTDLFVVCNRFLDYCYRLVYKACFADDRELYRGLWAAAIGALCLDRDKAWCGQQ
ncbi:unnamed protein product [Vicia faba]|uniref:Uncharacterized protein n=1 Tax=Vicia faba TaxID=3906 RepID=A0AAV0ZX00_VICFA|nr:unnamed protein product [Vicia faba]